MPERAAPEENRYGAATSDPLGREGPGWYKGDSCLPVLRKGWRWDPDTHKTAVIPGGVADPDRKRVS